MHFISVSKLNVNKLSHARHTIVLSPLKITVKVLNYKSAMKDY